MFNQKRGLSDVIVMLIMIVLALIAVGIIWGVVSNILSEETENIEGGFGAIFLDLNLEAVSVEENGDLSITVKRGNSGDEEIGFVVVLSDGENSETIESNETIGQLETKTFVISKSQFNLGVIKEVSIASIKNGNIGNVIDSASFSNGQIIENLGLVSWWKLNGNVDDDFEINDGQIIGDVDCDVEGIFGRGCFFDGDLDYIQIENDESLEFISEMSMSFWANFDSLNENSISHKAGSYGFWYSDSRGIYFRVNDGVGWNNCDSNFIPELDKWYHVVSTYDKNEGECKVYVDGNLEVNSNYNVDIAQSGTVLRVGGAGSGIRFNGTLDEVMVFNRALTDSEVEWLYEVELN